ncbi:MAG: lipoyl synthase [Gammaproteobacteria bacterium]|nr:lipoyl synthase [Gammaproteobacteria bacterium]
MAASCFEPSDVSADSTPPSKPAPVVQGVKLRAAEKMARIPVKIEATAAPLRKPTWIRAKSQGTPEVARIKAALRANKLHTVCEEAACPNLGECFGHGTATFMIMGDICTRRCPFCDVAHGRPNPLDDNEPVNLARTIRDMGLRYVVVTSVDRDDLKDGGAAHFAACIRGTRALSPSITIEVLVPDFRGRMDPALTVFKDAPPDVFNHNLETVPRLYKLARPGSDYDWSLDLLERFKALHPEVPTKSGLMLGLGEEIAEIEQVMADLRAHGVNMLTLGQYLQPSRHHLPVSRYVHPDEFERLRVLGERMGFSHVASGPMVRSSYHADRQAHGLVQSHVP